MYSTLLCYVRSIGTVSYVDTPHDDDYIRGVVQLENTYQLDPKTRFPVSAISFILKDVLETLKDKTYDSEECKSMTKSLSEVRSFVQIKKLLKK